MDSKGTIDWLTFIIKLNFEIIRIIFILITSSFRFNPNKNRCKHKHLPAGISVSTPTTYSIKSFHWGTLLYLDWSWLIVINPHIIIILQQIFWRKKNHLKSQHSILNTTLVYIALVKHENSGLPWWKNDWGNRSAYKSMQWYTHLAFSIPFSFIWPRSTSAL